MQRENTYCCPNAAQCPDLLTGKTQMERARQEAETAGRAKADFLARMSHEIRTPMNAVIGLAHLCMQTRLTEQQRQYVSKILASANSLLGILDEILDFSKAESGKLELDNLPFQISVIMDNLAGVISEKAEEKGLEYVFHTDGNIPPVLIGDPSRLTQVLANLASNAVKFTEKGTVALSVRCARQEGKDVILRFRVTDTGIGMSPEELNKVFQPFAQADGSMTRRFGGTGIGLSVSERLVQLMGGHITVESNPGGGSIFDFEARFQIGEPNEEAPPSSLRGLRALIVDDASLARQIAAANVRALGIVAHCASSGPEALSLLKEAEEAGRPYQVIILDWRMPDMDGVQTAKRIHAEWTGETPPVILMHSKYDLEEIHSKARDAGIAAFLPKPATSAAFHDAVQRALHGRNDKAPPEPGPMLTDNSRVLLVEDNEINQEIACELLKMAHVEVDVANNGEEAVNAVNGGRYALVFMDVQMPVMDGLEATRRIRAAGHAMPIIAMTAHATREDRDMSLAAGMNDHLTKPLAPEAFFATLNQWLPFASLSGPDGGSHDKTAGSHALPNDINGFDLSAGLAAVGNNEGLYVDLLGKFADRYATITEDITSSLMRNDLETAVRLAHTVRGIAANLGAESLAEAAGNLEKTITHDPSMIAPYLKTLVMRLAQAVTAVHVALGKHTEDALTRPTREIAQTLRCEEAERLGSMLEEALVNMEKDWNAAADAARYARGVLKDTQLEDQALQLVQAVEDFETEAALSFCRSMRETLRRVCAG